MSLTHINVRANGEYGDFYLLEGSEPAADGRTRHWCQLTCNTAFGVVGHTWCSMGMPAARFLAKVGKSYVLDKLWGLDSEVYDEEAARSGLVRVILQQRRGRDWDAEQTRDAYDEVLDADLATEAHYFIFVGERSWLYDLCMNGSVRYKHANPQAEGFWEDLWPCFLAELAGSRKMAHD